MKILLKYSLLLYFFLSNFCFSQTYSKIKIENPTRETFSILTSAGLPPEDMFFLNDAVEVTLNNRELEYLSKQKISFQIVIPDVSKWLKQRNEESLKTFFKHNETLPKGFSYGSMAGYPTISEYLQMLDTLSYFYPGLVKEKESIGKTFEKRDIYLLRVTNQAVQRDKKKVLITGLHHAREGCSLTAPLYYLCNLLQNYGEDSLSTFILDNRELFFVLMVNPDGYAYNERTNPEGFGMWRKNRTPFSGEYGVDLNRNYSYYWGYDDNGSSPSPWYDTHRGPHPFSEEETKAVKNLCETNSFSIALNYHTFGNYIIYPWGYANIESPDSVKFRALSKKISAQNKFVYGNAAGSIGYLVNGDSDDWMYGDVKQKNKIFAMTLELGSAIDYFWAPINRIKPIAEENIFANNYAALCAGAYVDSLVIRLAESNDSIYAAIRFRNTGLMKTEYSKVEILTDDPYLVVDSSFINTGVLESFSDTAEARFVFSFKPSTPAGYFAKCTVKLIYDGLNISRELVFRKSTNEIMQYTSIDAAQDKNKIIISWSTKSEPIHSGFVIERKLSGGSFEKAGEVKSLLQGSSSYSFNDYPRQSGEYSYRVKVTDNNLPRLSPEKKIFFRLLPFRYNLAQNFPNPFNPETQIRFTIPEPNKVTIKLYNLLGQLVKTITDDNYEAGEYSITFNSDGLPSQVYFYELTTPQFRQYKKLIILK